MDRAVLIGTQMVAKGHHFPGVDLAAVVDADTGPRDPRLPRRGADVPARHPARGPQRPRRAGPRHRADVPAGRDAVPVRRSATTSPGSSREELERRTALGYPPVSHLVTVVASGPDAAGVAQMLREVRDGLAGVDATLLGPAPLLRLRGRHRAQLVAKTQEPRALARRASRAARRRRAPRCGARGLTAVVDVDPQSL